MKLIDSNRQPKTRGTVVRFLRKPHGGMAGAHAT